MRIAVFGTGMVGCGIASRLVELDHDVMMGSRSATSAPLTKWVETNRPNSRGGTFAEAARHGEMLINATGGTVSLQALAAVEPNDLAGKILVDVANPLVAGDQAPLAVCNSDSLGEQIQRTYPEARVVKTLNTMNVNVMVHPEKVPGDHAVFVSGNDAAAKAEVIDLLKSMAWPRANIIDLGGIATARGTEMYLPLWLSLYRTLGTGHFNIGIRQ